MPQITLAMAGGLFLAATLLTSAGFVMGALWCSRFRDHAEQLDREGFEQ